MCVGGGRGLTFLPTTAMQAIILLLASRALLLLGSIARGRMT